MRLAHKGRRLQDALFWLIYVAATKYNPQYTRYSCGYIPLDFVELKRNSMFCKDYKRQDVHGKVLDGQIDYAHNICWRY